MRRDSVGKMKTLDEVIKAYEICIGYHCSNAEHDVCPYFCESDMGCMKEPEKDALHYLKEYRETKKHLACLDDAEIRGDNTQVVNNTPLTWDELRTMEGKPVWVEYNFHISNDKFRRWCIIREFKPWHDTEIIITDNGFVLSKNEQVTYWQAYRKERE